MERKKIKEEKKKRKTKKKRERKEEKKKKKKRMKKKKGVRTHLPILIRKPFPSVFVSMITYRGTSLVRNCPPPKDHHRTLGMVLQ